MFDRLLLTVGIAAIAWLLYRAVSWLLLRRSARDALGLQSYQLGRPAILYFTAPGCAPCRTIQEPALAALQERYGGGVQVIRIDAIAAPEVADHWAVLSLPTTFIIDSRGRPRKVNHGPARLERLERQLAVLEELPQAESSGSSRAKGLIGDVSQRG